MTEIKVTEGGFVKLFRVDGTDADIMQIARISYNHDHIDQGEHDHDRVYRFIHMLLDRGHLGPFEMCHLTLEIKTPMDTWRQWVRHRTASINEQSTRYTQIDTSLPMEQLCNLPVTPTNGMDDIIASRVASIFRMYDSMIASGVRPEVARSILPLCTYTRAYWQVDLRNLMHFLDLRLDNHAQGGPGSIREYAIAVDSIFKSAFPITHNAYHSIKVV